MQITQSSLAIIGANTPEAKVFWNGQQVEFAKLSVKDGKVTLTVAENPLLAEMRAAGITIRRA